MSTSSDQTYAAGAAVRWCRAVLLCLVGLGSGLVAHVSAGGLLPGPTTFVVLFVVGTLGCASFLGRPASRACVVGLVVAGQTVVHGTLTAISGHRGDPPVVTAPRTPAAVLPTPATNVGSGRRGSYFDLAYSAHPARTDVPVTVPAPVQHLLADMTGPHAVMALAHLAAAVVVGLWLASGERALWAILVLLRETTRAAVTAGTTALALLRTSPAPVGRTPRLAADDLGPPALPRLARTVVRRGPPLCLAG